MVVMGDLEVHARLCAEAAAVPGLPLGVKILLGELAVDRAKEATDRHGKDPARERKGNLQDGCVGKP
jgi:hypothetical protein